MAILPKGIYMVNAIHFETPTVFSSEPQKTPKSQSNLEKEEQRTVRTGDHAL